MFRRFTLFLVAGALIAGSLAAVSVADADGGCPIVAVHHSRSAKSGSLRRKYRYPAASRSPAAEAPRVDLSQFSLAPVGSDMGQARGEPAAPPPDTSHLKLQE